MMIPENKQEDLIANFSNLMKKDFSAVAHIYDKDINFLQIISEHNFIKASMLTGFEPPFCTSPFMSKDKYLEYIKYMIESKLNLNSIAPILYKTIAMNTGSSGKYGHIIEQLLASTMPNSTKAKDTLYYEIKSYEYHNEKCTVPIRLGNLSYDIKNCKDYGDFFKTDIYKKINEMILVLRDEMYITKGIYIPESFWKMFACDIAYDWEQCGHHLNNNESGSFYGTILGLRYTVVNKYLSGEEDRNYFLVLPKKTVKMIIDNSFYNYNFETTDTTKINLSPNTYGPLGEILEYAQSDVDNLF